MSHRWLIGMSAMAHVAVAGGLFVSGVWNLERLEAPRHQRQIVLPRPPPAPSGPLVAAATLPFERRRPRSIPRDVVQPYPTTQVEPLTQVTTLGGPGTGPGPGDPDATGTCLENCGPPEPVRVEPTCGNSSLELGEQCDDSNRQSGDGCSSTCTIEVKPPQTRNVAPTVLQSLRLSGETQVHPSAATQQQMIRSDVSQVRGTLLVCIATDGSVASAALQASTKFPDYDAALVDAVRGWRYRPYMADGVPTRACSLVTFVYTIRR